MYVLPKNVCLKSVNSHASLRMWIVRHNNAVAFIHASSKFSSDGLRNIFISAGVNHTSGVPSVYIGLKSCGEEQWVHLIKLCRLILHQLP